MQIYDSMRVVTYQLSADNTKKDVFVSLWGLYHLTPAGVAVYLFTFAAEVYTVKLYKHLKNSWNLN